MPKLNKNKPSKMFEKRPVKKVAPVETAASIHEAKERSKKAFSVVRGMHDSLPKEEKYWLAFQHEAESLAEYFQFGRIETPILEEANLFVRSIGRGTDVVDKEMYVFEDRDGSKKSNRLSSIKT
jgi:histidyl-tRNA synthetase